jgi:glutamate formiminotransferase/glutamate formiminotransferase/formiminotetrahydrofolate cyclodeaminase
VTRLLAAPNVSEGRDRDAITAIGEAFDAELLDVHSDPDHNRSVFTLAGAPGRLAHAVSAGAKEAIARIDLKQHRGVHPRVGALDVAPIVFLTESELGAACAEALLLADLLGHELGLPVFLYGELGGGRTRAELRRGGPQSLQRRIDGGELAPDFGPARLHVTAGAVLVAARPPLVAFNVELARPATEADAKQIAAGIREAGGEGLKGVRAIGLWLEGRATAQVSTNVEDYRSTPLAEVLDAVSRNAPIARVELVGLAPRAAFDGFPGDVEVVNKRLIEDALTDSL